MDLRLLNITATMENQTENIRENERETWFIVCFIRMSNKKIFHSRSLELWPLVWGP